MEQKILAFFHIHYMLFPLSNGMQTTKDAESTIFNSDPDSILYQYRAGIDRINHELTRFGLTKIQAQVYIFLGKYGSKTSPEVSRALKLPRTETYQILKVLQNLGIIASEFSHPARFSAIPLEKALLSMVNSAQEKVNSLVKKEQEISRLWKEIPIFNSENKENPSEKFQILQGTPIIHNKIKEMLHRSKRECKFFCTPKDLSKFYYNDIIEQTNNLHFYMKFIISSPFIIPDLIHKIGKSNVKLLSKFDNSDQCFIISDSEELLIFLKNASYPARDVLAFWTNSKSMIDSMMMLFDYSWIHSIFYKKN